VLREFVVDDFPDTHRFRSDPDVVRYMDSIESESETRAWIDSVIFHNAQIPRTSYNLAITRKDDGRVIGWIGFGDSEGHPGPGNHGVGYMLARECWGLGYGTESLRAVIGFIVGTLHGERIYTHCHAANVGSFRVMEKSGMVRIREYQDIDDRDGSPYDSLEYVYDASAQPGR
jgi:RimJ/RimL family protein N-acetyltransferase